MQSELDKKLEGMYKDHTLLMQSITNTLFKKGEDPRYYDKSTHHFLKDHAWEIMLPLPKERWPKKYSELSKSFDPEMSWPNFTMYCYSSCVLFPPMMDISSLLLGYAVMEDNTVLKTTFFEGIMMDGLSYPKSVAIDPLADMHGIKPKYYVGVSVEKEDLQRFLLNRDILVLEGYVERKNEEAHKERLHQIYMKAYEIQMTYEPHYLPRRLQEFARENGLSFPEDQRSSV